MKKPPYYVTDPRHFLDAQGLLPEKLPGPARKLISFLGQIIEESSLRPPGEAVETSLKCMRRPGRKPCQGKIIGQREDDEGPIVWKCNACNAGGEIHNWKRTQWDNSMGTVH